jgi:hypothetical protein
LGGYNGGVLDRQLPLLDRLPELHHQIGWH